MTPSVLQTLDKKRISSSLILLASTAFAYELFQWGLSYPLQLRVRGDAREYMLIASQFRHLGELLAYVGERTVGLPVIAYFVRAVLDAFNVFAYVETWANGICAILFALHVTASAATVSLARSQGVITTPWGSHLLYFLVVSFPALVGHTTVPLTDTAAISVVILALWFSQRAQRAAGAKQSVFWTICAGSAWAFAVLLRPGYGPAVWGALGVGIIAALRVGAKHAQLAAATLVIAVVCVAPVAARCHARYGTVCLQDPNTFDAGRHARMGIKGARILWNHPSYENDEFPVVPDAFMVEHFYLRCPVSSLLGGSLHSLSGCLISRPHLVPIYVLKKWIGLFDHFRFQPYVESLTPRWMRALSRSYDVCAWIGFWFAWSLGLRWAWPRVRSRPATSTWPSEVPLVMGVFVLLMLGEHTLLHVEDRFSVSWLALSCAFSIRWLEQLVDALRRSRWRVAASYVVPALIAAIVFLEQVWAWDRVQF